MDQDFTARNMSSPPSSSTPRELNLDPLLSSSSTPLEQEESRLRSRSLSSLQCTPGLSLLETSSGRETKSASASPSPIDVATFSRNSPDIYQIQRSSTDISERQIHHHHPFPSDPSSQSFAATRIQGDPKLSYSKQRSRQITRIINATYARCRGEALDEYSSNLAFPVYKTRNTFLIPATHSDFAALKRNIHKTDAAYVNVAYKKVLNLPDHPNTRKCIHITMPSVGHEVLSDCAAEIHAELALAQWSHDGKKIKMLKSGSAVCTLRRPGKNDYKALPDQSIMVTGAVFPFLVVETGVRQPWGGSTGLRTKIHRWVQGGKGHLKIIVVLELRGTRPEFKVLASVYKVNKEASTDVPGNWHLAKETLHDRTEIYPNKSTESFEISLADILPRDVHRGPLMYDQKIFIQLGSFFSRCFSVVHHLNSVQLEGGISPTHSDQEDIPTPENSDEETIETESEEEVDDWEGDPSFNDDDGEPSCDWQYDEN